MKMSKKDKQLLLKAEISSYLIYSGYNKEELALKLGISRASFYNKVNDLDRFTFREISELFQILKMDDEKKLKLLAA